MSKTPQPSHVPGTVKGEELALESKEEGRGDPNTRNYQTARDSTGINAAARNPIHPDMPNLPPP